MKVIGVAGQLRNGKDEVANYLASRLPTFERGSFAFNVKRTYCDTFNVDMAFVEEWKTKPEIPPGFDLNVRQGLQLIGDGFRKIQGNIWINLLFRNRERDVIISDVRYINELRTIRAHGGINVLVYREGFLNDDPNGSEAQIRPFVEYFIRQEMEGAFRPESYLEEPYDLIDVFIRNDGTINDLQIKVEDVLLPFVRERFYA